MLENFGKCDALGPSKPFEEYIMYKFSARLLKNSPKKCGLHESLFFGLD